MHIRLVGHTWSSRRSPMSSPPTPSASPSTPSPPPPPSFSASQLLCLLLINWGAHRDLRGILPPASTAFVVDSHRPVHLHNLAAANDRVVVLFSTDDEHTADLSYDFDVSALANASDLTADGDADEHLRVSEEDEDSDASDSDSESVD